MKKKCGFFLGILCCMLAGACGTKGNSKPTEAPENNLTVTPGANPVVTQEPGSEIGVTPMLSPTPEPTPILRCRTEIERTRETEDGVVFFTSELSYPVFEGIGAEGLNREITAIVEVFQAEREVQIENAKQDYADSKKNGQSFEAEVDDFHMTATGENENMLSFVSVRYTNGGGPHPNTNLFGYVLNKENGARVSMDDFLKENNLNLTAEKIAQTAAEEFLAQMGGDADTFMISKSLPETVLDFINENHWFFSDNKITVFINPYEIAPYACGSFEYSLEFSAIK